VEACPPRVRVYLVTYRRPKLLKRALKSLCEQRFVDWVCELHNDAPGDDGCRKLVEAIGDPRITLFDHPANLGAVETFNLCWKPIPNEFMSILEDDNWWEPDFLEEMVGIMDAHPEVDVAWSNMVRWQERPDDQWVPDGTVWSRSGPPLEFFNELHPRQMMEALHSQGAMLVRAVGPHMTRHPDATPDFIMDAVKEHYMRPPLVLHRRPLANFALTLTTARNETLVEKVGGQALLAMDVLARNDVSREFFHQAWEYDWLTGGYARRALIVACLLSGRGWSHLRTVWGREFLKCVLWFLRHPLLTVGIVRYVLSDKQISAFLAGAARAREAAGPPKAPVFRAQAAE
jgi:glycosyltransferase involved in cell wall biosynthesis